MNNKIEIYENNSIDNPKYLFHGSPKILEQIEQRQAHDSDHNPDNEDYAVFLTSSFIVATAYAFKDKIKENSTHWNFKIGCDEIVMDNVNTDDEQIGYVYVFKIDELNIESKAGHQYKVKNTIKPIDIVKVKFKDYKEYYQINQNIKKR